MRRDAPRGLTLVELVLVMAITSILALMTPLLMFYGVKTMVFMPKALAVNQVASEILQQTIEGGWSSLTGQTVRGLRFAVRDTSEAAVWQRQANQVGFRTSDNQCVLIQLSSGVLRRFNWPATPNTPCGSPQGGSENFPYDNTMGVQIIAPDGLLFQYYSPGGVIRRVDIAFRTQTGSGLFEEGNAREDISSSVAIRVP